MAWVHSTLPLAAFYLVLRFGRSLRVFVKITQRELLHDHRSYRLCPLFSQLLKWDFLQRPYPPFGFATYCLLGLSSYMIFLGLYSSAISVSQSIQLRRSIEESIKGDSNLLSSIGTAEMQEQVLRKVDGLKDVVEESEREMRARSGIESSIPKEDILTYLEEALQEVGKSKKTK